MKAPSCTVCQVRYDEDERVPLLLQCGHGFCKDCLSRMFAASSDNSLSCPRCRHASPVGNSVHALRKNFAVIALLRSSANWDDDSDDDGGGGGGGVDGEEDEGDGGLGFRSFRSRCCSSAGECIDLAGHQGLRLLRPIADGPRGGQDVWEAVLSGGRGAASSASAAARGCRHRVAVKRVALSEEMDLALVQSRLESLRRASMWCRNVCAFHGVTRMEGRLCLVMERYAGSVLSEMQRNSGRLTLEQILRFGFCFLGPNFGSCLYG